ncbi:hypothetical protein SO802_012368 [Lithocarpus litseifolius]|uniref:DUF4283 domain-containing protein n=1 Tax=Lithocarpus litseifolius TaxID=425828 RepID=A0AAW2D2J7_9ROSI
MSETAIRSREEDEELQRSTKTDANVSYKEKLLKEIPGAFEHAFKFGFNVDTEAESDDEFPELPLGEKAVRFFGSMKTKIRAPWLNALIMKVFGKTVGYHFLHSRILNLWKPAGKMVCVDLGNDFFLIKFQLKEDYAKVLREGPWFVGGHYLSIRCWEPNFKSSTANLSSVAVWIHLPKLLIEYYEPSALRETGEAIGLVLRIDAHTTAVLSPSRPTVGSVKVGENSFRGNQKPIFNLDFSVKRKNHFVKPKALSKPTPRVKMIGAKGRVGVGDELSLDPMESPKLPAEDMQLDEGETAPNPS